MSGLLLVNGAATDASASEREIPMSAVLSAGASFAPSPVNPLPRTVVNIKSRKCLRVPLTQYNLDFAGVAPTRLFHPETFGQR
jgi:hypothetical protein